MRRRMWTVEDPHLAEQDYRYPAALTFQDLCTEALEQGLNVLPRDVRTGRTRVDRLKRALVTALHRLMVPRQSTTAARALRPNV